MTKEEITRQIQDIEAMEKEGDWESAHGLEDMLREAFLRWLAQEAPEPFAALAALVLTSQKPTSIRWCA